MTKINPQDSFDENELVSLSWLASTALARPSTVSNWRKRDPQFPQPAGGTDSRPLFRRDDLLEWGRHSGRFDPSLAAPDRSIVERASAVLNVFRGHVAVRDYMEAATAVFERLFNARASMSSATPSSHGLGADVLEDLAAAARPIVEGAEPSELFEAILQQVAARGLGREEHQTPEWMAEFMAAQVAGKARTVIDPAAGIGTLLISAASALGASSVTGYDINEAALRVLQLRAMLSGIDATVEARDIIRDPPVPLPQAPAVLVDAPFALRYPGRELLGDSRFSAISGSSISGDSIWAQIAISHLTEGGTAVVHIIGSAAYGPRDRQFREELISSGAVLAVVALKGGLGKHGPMRSNAWVLRTPTRNPSATVRFVDAERVPHHELASQLGNVLELDPSASSRDFDVVDVSRLELLRSDSLLTPARWTASQYEEGQARADLRAAQDMLEQIIKDKQFLVDGRLDHKTPRLAEPPLRTTTLRELRDQKLARRLRQVGDSRPAGELEQSESLPVVTSRELREGFSADDAPRVPNSIVRDELRHGDILYGEVGENSRITVWSTEGTWALGRGVGAYRLSTSDLLPGYVASLLTSTQASAFNTGSTIPRRNVDLVPIPLIPLEQQREVTEALMELKDAEERAASLTRHLATLRHKLVDVAAAGYLSITHDGQSSTTTHELGEHSHVD